MHIGPLTLQRRNCRTRLPFRFGKATLTAAPLLTARIEVDGVAGRSADLLVPKWFDKTSPTSDAEDQVALEASARAAGERWAAAARELPTLFEQWLAVYRALVECVPLEAPDRLVRGFGVALVERAVMDAVCRREQISFFEAWRRDTFGVRPGLARLDLADYSPAAEFERQPLQSIRVRHTVGMLDALTEDEVPAEARGIDGHPCSLVEDIRAYGLDAFKLKVGGDAEQDLERLDRIGQVLERSAPGAIVTLDGNEMYADPSRLADVLQRLGDRRGGPPLLDNLAHIEQPAPRAATFAEATRAGLRRLAAFAPVIIDEADLGLEAFPRAFALGYRGVSVKNCKGVLRAVLNHGLCSVLGDGAFLAGEDLTNLPALPLQQDLATAALLHQPHVERNGHHYFRGLDHLDPDERERCLAAHPDIYRQTEGGGALSIERGRITIGSLACVGYGAAL